MENYIIVTWPEIQKYMEYSDFEDHSTIINPKIAIGIDGCTYLIDKEWYNKKIKIIYDTRF